MSKVVFYGNVASIPCEGFALIVRTISSVSDVKVFQSFNRLVEQLKISHPNLLVIDTDNQIFNPTNIQTIISEFPLLPILIFYDTYALPQLTAIFEIGIIGCWAKSSPTEQLLTAIENNLCGKFSFDLLAQQYLNNNKAEVEQPIDTALGLSCREHEVYLLLLAGKSTNQIAHQLFISAHTVHTHRKNIFRKLKVHSLPELIIKANERYLS